MCPRKPLLLHTRHRRRRLSVELAADKVPSRLHNEISVAVISYIPEGLFGEYFSDISFKFPLYSRIDKRVNFTWDDEIERVNEFSSVRWSGSILSNFSEIFEFTLDVGERDNVRMWVGKKII